MNLHKSTANGKQSMGQPENTTSLQFINNMLDKAELDNIQEKRSVPKEILRPISLG